MGPSHTLSLRSKYVYLPFLLLMPLVFFGCGGGGSTPPLNPVPSISSISPSSISVNSLDTPVTISGSGFISTSTVQINGQSLTPSSVTAGTTLLFTLTAANLKNAGSLSVTVTNPGVAPSQAATISVTNPMPSISSLSPSTIAVNSAATTITVSGSGFVQTSTVEFNGSLQTTTFVSSTQLQAALMLGDFSAAGTAQIVVVNPAPGGGSSSAATLTISSYPIPAITSINPNSISANSPDTSIIIVGTGFSTVSTVQVNGNTVASAFGRNALFLTLPAAALTSVGTLSVTVVNPGVPPSQSAMINVTQDVAPTLSGLSENAVAIGGANFQLMISGSNFVLTSVVQWNGSPRPTTYGNQNQLTATISAKDIESFGTSNVTVSTPAPGGGVSTALPFTTYLALSANDLVYSQSMQLLYASVPGAAGPPLGNSIVSIDPYTGVMGTPIFVGSEPGKMALSSDGNTIWVALNGAAAVREVNLSTSTAGLQFSLGGGIGVYSPPATAQAIAVMPGQPNTIAVAAIGGLGFGSGVTIYDSGVARTNAQTTNVPNGIVRMVFDSTGTKLYEAGSGYGVGTVDGTGITSGTLLNTTVFTNDLRIDNGRAYLTNGAILDANSGAQLGVFSVSATQSASGPVAPDSTIGEGFVLINSNFSSGFQINTYDLSTFVLKGSIPLAGVNSSFPQSPSSLMRWGQDGLAFITGTQLYVVRSPLVRDLSGSLADLSVSASASGSGTTGTNLTFTETINNAGPLAATPATLIDNIPAGAVLQSVTPSQGACSGTSIVYCNLGNLNSGSSATVQITITPLSPGALTNTASVTAPQGDPNTSNNSVVSTFSITGSVYNVVPGVTSISPSFVQAGSASFTLTVNGVGFSSGSTVQLNSTALPTTFVSSNQLTATVDSTNIASLGWSWINVTNAAPGGGVSSSLPLTVYTIISLDTNRLSFDPYTRKLFATVPSTATQVIGNSLVTIDPASPSLGTPFNIGSEPNQLAESSDGTYLYVNLVGSQSLTRVNLTSMTQGPVYPLTLPSSPSTPVTARDIAVAPGNDNLLAVDTGAGGGIGLLDISGATATFRPHLTLPYSGSDLAFADASTVYSYDIDTSGAEFNRWGVTSTGLTLNNNTGYTLNGIGGFKLENGLVYGFAGGVVDPTTTPPKQLGQFSVSSAQGFGQDIQGTGVAADPALGRVFFIGETLAGSANPVLSSYDSNKYLLLNMQTFTGAAQGLDLVRWGRDGLAWHTASGGFPFGSGPGAGQIFLVRGPFVLPEWGANNPTPSLTSVSPASVSVGSGNVTLTIVGSNFVPGAIVLWNNAERSTTFVDSSHLTVAIPASDVSQSSTANLTVNNPGSNNSSAVSVSIQ